ncbi:MAG: 16S rRNA (guanine(527)-N(7))-methyltransferase RsmG [Clostridia bacterium]|nr:16S rRNA (guanine(527)-N(7))-methyltransferase RsmG [Clostridia bacterium]
MENLFSSYNLKLNSLQLERFNKYYELLVYYNKQFNLTAITEKQEVYEKHFIDSVLGNNYLNGKTLLDVGSGGGFPAIPIKILKEELNVTLLEATGKKCEFLKTVIKELNLENIKVINDRAEILAKDVNFREKFDIVTARAVARLNTLAEYTMPFVKVGGNLVAFKGNAEEEVLESKNAISILGGKLKEVVKYNLNDANRCLVIVEKIKNTPNKYPRGNGKERKNPL